MVAAHLVGVRRAELALHLPDQVGEVGARRDAVEQRRVEALDRVPVDAGDVGRPELVALQAPHLAQHLAPFAPRLDGDANAVEVDPAVLARRRPSASAGSGLARACGRRRSRAGACRRGRRARRRRAAIAKSSIFSASVSVRPVAKSKRSSLPGRFLVAAAAVRADDVLRVPDDLRAGHAGDAAVAPFGDRKGGDAADDAVEVDAHRRGSRPRPRLLAAVRLHPCVGPRAPCAARDRRAAAARLQRDQVGPRAAREAEVEADVVVDRIEGAHRHEVEVAPSGSNAGAESRNSGSVSAVVVFAAPSTA